MSLHELYQILSYVSLLSTTFPLFLLTRRPVLSRQWQVLGLYLLIAFLLDLASFVLVKGLHKANYEMIYVFNFIEAFFIGWFFQTLFGVRERLFLWFVGLAAIELFLFVLFRRDFNSIFAVLT